MEVVKTIIDFILHIDMHLVGIINNYQSWTYLILFLIIFAETGLVVTPFLPGDSVLFAMGALLAKPENELSLILMIFLLIMAAILGDFVNYEIGKFFGIKVFKEDAKIFKLSYLKKTEAFYRQYGNKTIVYARFVPIVRTFAPFVAGVGKMPYKQFGRYNMTGAVLWVPLFLLVGYFFGQIGFIQRNFSIVVLLIIVISIVPVVLQFMSKKKGD